MTPYADITGWGMSVPAKILTNDEIAQFVDTSDAWIREMTGIHERRIANPEETTGLLATQKRPNVRWKSPMCAPQKWT